MNEYIIFTFGWTIPLRMCLTDVLFNQKSRESSLLAKQCYLHIHLHECRRWEMHSAVTVNTPDIHCKRHAVTQQTHFHHNQQNYRHCQSGSQCRVHNFHPQCRLVLTSLFSYMTHPLHFCEIKQSRCCLKGYRSPKMSRR